jgi:CheY-like chemotaxis protein
LRRVLAALLEAAGYEVIEASTGREALKRAIMLEPDIILR